MAAISHNGHAMPISYIPNTFWLQRWEFMILRSVMEMLTDQALLAKVEQFIADKNIPPSRFGREVMGDGALIQTLREGRSLTLKNAGKVIQYIQSYRPETR